MPKIGDFRDKTFDQIVAEFKLTDVYSRYLDFWRYIRIAKGTWGHVIETTYEDEFKVATIETLITYTGRVAFMCNREIEGDYNPMEPRGRERRFPLGGIVNLRSEHCQLNK